ncbi:hypothetical protein [Akkermansia massiliensis]
MGEISFKVGGIYLRIQGKNGGNGMVQGKAVLCFPGKTGRQNRRAEGILYFVVKNEN